MVDMPLKNTVDGWALETEYLGIIAVKPMKKIEKINNDNDE